jgi:hypothetical protein
VQQAHWLWLDWVKPDLFKGENMQPTDEITAVPKRPDADTHRDDENIQARPAPRAGQ